MDDGHCHKVGILASVVLCYPVSIQHCELQSSDGALHAMGCAVSNSRTLCKGIGVEDDKPGGILSRAKGMFHDQDKAAMNSAMTDANRTGTNMISNLNNSQTQRMVTEESNGGGFTQRITNFENNLRQKGSDTVGAIADKGRDTMQHTVEDLEGLGETIGESVQTGAEDMVKTGREALEEAKKEVEDEVKKVSDSMKDKLDQVKDNVNGMINTDQKTDKNKDKQDENESKEDIGDKIDEILALSIDENS